MAERLVEVLRDEGSLALTTEEAQSKSEALLDAGFLTVDLSTLPRAETVSTGPYNEQLRIGSVSLKTTWADDETTQRYIERHMELAIDHIAAAKWVAENPPPPPPVYRDERKVLLTWQHSASRYPTESEYMSARWELLERKDAGFRWDARLGDTRLLDVREDGEGFLHLFGVEVSRKVRVEEES